MIYDACPSIAADCGRIATQSQHSAKKPSFTNELIVCNLLQGMVPRAAD